MKTNYLKLGVLSLMMLAGTAINAQTTTQTDTKLNKKTDAASDAVVRVIDNKGTIKYLQSSNGITTITSTTAGNATTTTWQLGGTLTDSTYIDVSDKIFALDGIKLITPSTATGSEATLASTNAVTLSDGKAGGTAGGTGWAVLIRNEATGETQKILASALITAGRQEFPIAADGNVAVTASGLALGTAISKVSVYRNGAKLRASIDYNVTAADTVTLTLNSTAPNDWTTYVGDIIEVQWIY
ncbi:hypothetical protein [Polaribacter glomeratus]|uniref:Uncharacterized protein n=1 Tax=Polaribacter glomeratus TaxID=102 RepID=A0A2S7WVD8_9FLAO|nr:hypothetical protein [Polaribacter glomeratus]PQJ81560.1 hypothetical protein BTO16_02795 [Polaribacter glomeratus]TXD64610.1 hypothetical protein ESX12_13780 [Polaribacter glomeratus]